jgi:hypothetical protein
MMAIPFCNKSVYLQFADIVLMLGLSVGKKVFAGSGVVLSKFNAMNFQVFRVALPFIKPVTEFRYGAAYASIPDGYRQQVVFP